MATTTIDGLTVTTSAAAGDFVPIWRASNGDTRKITKANFIGATITGAGTIATGGYTLTVGGTSTVNGSLVGSMTGSGTIATGGFTGTLPATGTLSLLGTAQTYSALKTFSAGLTFGESTLSNYYGTTWTPVAAGATLSVAAGRYTRIGRMVFANFNLTWPTTSDTTNISVSGLPYTPAAIGGTTGGGGYLFVSTYTANSVIVRVNTDATISFVTAGGTTLQNADFSAKTVRGWVIYDV